MKKIGIVIITYNDKVSVLTQCLNSLQNSVFQDFQVLIVDNSANDKIKDLTSEFHGFDYVAMPSNLGFAQAVNYAFNAMQDIEYYLILNGDVYFDDNVLGDLYKKLDNNHNIGIAGIRMHYPNGDLQSSVRKFPTFTDQFMIMTKLHHLMRSKIMGDYLMSDFDLYSSNQVDSVMGAFMAIRGDVVSRIGGFDDNYFLWYEEVDYCKMAKEAGFEIWHLGDVQVYHHKGSTFANCYTWQKQKWMRSSLRRYTYKWFSRVEYVIWLLLQPLFYIIALMTSIIKKK